MLSDCIVINFDENMPFFLSYSILDSCVKILNVHQMFTRVLTFKFVSIIAVFIWCIIIIGQNFFLTVKGHSLIMHLKPS